MKYPPNFYILDPEQQPQGFYSNCGNYAAVPIACSKQFMVLGPNKDGMCVQLKKCRTKESAHKFIAKMTKK